MENGLTGLEEEIGRWKEDVNMLVSGAGASTWGNPSMVPVFSSLKEDDGHLLQGVEEGQPRCQGSELLWWCLKRGVWMCPCVIGGASDSVIASNQYDEVISINSSC